ncbi:MAG: tetratricopeptide repeat protein [Candidatus Sericytochromatia bacterium]
MKSLALLAALGLAATTATAPAWACALPAEKTGVDTKAVLQEAYFLDRQGQYADALKLYKKVLDVQPDNRKAHYYKANTHWRDNNLKEARAAWESVLRMENDDRWASEARQWLKNHKDIKAAGARVVTVAFKDGLKTKTRFMDPTSMFVSRTGNMYVADQGAHRILRVGLDGVLEVAAGNGRAGILDGPAMQAMVNRPKSMVADPVGNIYFIDGNRVRFHTPNGKVGTLAGREEAASRDGDWQTARFYAPSALAVDHRGNVYVAEGKVPAIRKITPDGTTSLFVGGSAVGFADGNGASAQFKGISAMTVTPAGDLLVSDTGANRLRRVTPSGDVMTITGCGKAGFADGPVERAHFRKILGLVRDADGNTFVADTGNFAIRKISVKDEVVTLAGGDGDGNADGVGILAKFKHPTDISVSQGELYVLDRSTNTVRKVSLGL